jgi:hypothetical protein
LAKVEAELVASKKESTELFTKSLQEEAHAASHATYVKEVHDAHATDLIRMKETIAMTHAVELSKYEDALRASKVQHGKDVQELHARISVGSLPSEEAVKVLQAQLETAEAMRNEQQLLSLAKLATAAAEYKEILVRLEQTLAGQSWTHQLRLHELEVGAAQAATEAAEARARAVDQCHKEERAWYSEMRTDALAARDTATLEAKRSTELAKVLEAELANAKEAAQLVEAAHVRALDEARLELARVHRIELNSAVAAASADATQAASEEHHARVAAVCKASARARLRRCLARMTSVQLACAWTTWRLAAARQTFRVEHAAAAARAAAQRAQGRVAAMLAALRDEDAGVVVAIFPDVKSAAPEPRTLFLQPGSDSERANSPLFSFSILSLELTFSILSPSPGLAGRIENGLPSLSPPTPTVAHPRVDDFSPLAFIFPPSRNPPAAPTASPPATPVEVLTWCVAFYLMPIS